MFRCAVPILPVRDVGAALDFYARLGFEVRAYADGGDYGYATREDVEIHLGRVMAGEHHGASAYVHVVDADAVAAEWRAAGAEVHGPQDTEWGKHEGALVDPDGNVIRFGSPIARQAPEGT
jgi:uncharacterized glyoxalase superfamily protein PhnB